ncbi:MAG: 2,5-diamino-6-(ribosylamino)-4(3H)-pyrimidinone 5'-phosphate reductase [Candidatus Odinarchaeota archaeon]
MDENERPRVILNCAMSIDGKIATESGDATLSNREDWIRVHQLRNSVDAIMVGINTILKDDSKLTVKEEYINKEGRDIQHPLRVVVDSAARLPLSARVIQYKKNEVKTVVAVSHRAEREKVRKIKEQGVLVFQAGQEKVDLQELFCYLKRELAVKTLLLEGGGTLNWNMLQSGLIDELRVFLAPVVASGFGSIPLFWGEGYKAMNDGPLFQLKALTELGDGVLMEYEIDYNSMRKL